MALRPRRRRINPIARAPILRKGGAHEKSRSGERQQYKQQLKQKLLKEEAGEGDFPGFFMLLRHVVLPCPFVTINRPFVSNRKN